MNATRLKTPALRASRTLLERAQFAAFLQPELLAELGLGYSSTRYPGRRF